MLGFIVAEVYERVLMRIILIYIRRNVNRESHFLHFFRFLPDYIDREEVAFCAPSRVHVPFDSSNPFGENSVMAALADDLSSAIAACGVWLAE